MRDSWTGKYFKAFLNFKSQNRYRSLSQSKIYLCDRKKELVYRLLVEIVIDVVPEGPPGVVMRIQGGQEHDAHLMPQLGEKRLIQKCKTIENGHPNK